MAVKLSWLEAAQDVSPESPGSPAVDNRGTDLWCHPPPQGGNRHFMIAPPPPPRGRTVLQKGGEMARGAGGA